MAAATHGTKRTTSYKPNCPEKIDKVPKSDLPGYLKRCPKLQKQEYKKQETKVAEIIIKSAKVQKKSYQQQKKELIAAVNNLAQLAGPLPSL